MELVLTIIVLAIIALAAVIAIFFDDSLRPKLGRLERDRGDAAPKRG